MGMMALAISGAGVPVAPSSLTATAASSSQINLSWTDNSTNETGFKIERKTGSGGTWSQIATVGAGVTSYSNTGLSAFTTYYYRVRATNSAGDSAYSNEASATTGGSTGLVSNLSVASGKAYIWDLLDVGKLQYIDRTYTFSAAPAAYVGLQYLRTANDDKGSTGSSFISFDVSKSVTVYVGHDDRFTTKPSWLSGWTNTGADLVSGGGTFSLFAKDFAAGKVTLGGNTADGVAANSMYTVVVKEKVTGGFSITIDYVSTGKAYSVSTAKAGALYYIDRSYTISSLSSVLNNQGMIRTANDDKGVTAGVHLKFTVNQSASVYVCYDKRATTLPGWLKDGTWTVTGEGMVVTDGGASPMKVYVKAVGARQVVLGGNKAGGGDGAGSNYFVVVKGSGVGKEEMWEAMVGEGPMDPGAWVHEGDSDGDGLRDDYEAAQLLDPQKVDTDGDGEVDETELAGDERTYWEGQMDWAPPVGEDGGGDSGCGATGMELIAIIMLAALRRISRR